MKYTGRKLKNISFPLGGIGTGCIGLAGGGRLCDWEIFGRPDKGSVNGRTHIAVKLKIGNKTYLKVLNSDLETDLSGPMLSTVFRGFGHGADKLTMCGFPHFENCEFSSTFPFAELTFSDKDFPGEVSLCAFNPFIPQDSKNSSIPGAFFEITYENKTGESVEFSGVFSLANPYEKAKNERIVNGDITSIRLMNAEKTPDEIGYGDLSLSCQCATASQEYWYRGLWEDNVTTFWNEFKNSDTLIDRNYDAGAGASEQSQPGTLDTCSMLKKVTLKPGEVAKIRFVVSWNVPNFHMYWAEEENVSWKNYYATVFKDSVDSGVYALSNWEDLYTRSKIFAQELSMTTIPNIAKEAIEGTMATLKSPTVSRLADGSLYGFEGSHEHSGSCEGNCQHVYNYAYVTSFLFPDLERSMRDLEFNYQITEDGETKFRLPMPLGREWCLHITPIGDRRHACVDGQMGLVIKTYREWKISGDTDWLRKNWDKVKLVISYVWSEKNPDLWDPQMSGVITGMQHHTLDVELFGANSWLQGFYMAALSAAREMAEFLGDEIASTYRTLLEKGKEYTKNHLFNGEYFIQNIDLSDKTICENFDSVKEYWNDEAKEIKYQIGEGSSIDQLTGQWHADILGLGEFFDKDQKRTALKSMMKYNFCENMRNVVNTFRVFALNDEAGSIMCAYPEGVKTPAIPITYSTECMTGFEYAFAGLLFSEGMVDEATRVIFAVRNRYDGEKRNPWNELECGSNYVRAMSSYAFIPILSGFSFNMAKSEIGFNPKINPKNFRSIFSVGGAWGNVQMTKKSTRINLCDGELFLKKLTLPYITSISNVLVDGKEVDFCFSDGAFTFEGVKVEDYIEIEY